MINRGRRKVPANVEHIKADKNDFSAIAKALEGRSFDAIMDYLCYTDKETQQSVNFYKQYTTQYFYISSCAVYNTQIAEGALLDEESEKVLPIWKYSVDKWASEQKLVELFKDTDVKYTIIRPGVTYGDTRIPYGISPQYGYHWTLCARILADKPIIRWNKGVNKCNMTRVEDFAVGVVGLIGNEKAYNQSFNVCGDETPTFNDVLNTLSEILGHKIITVDLTSDFYAKETPLRSGEILGGRSIDAINSNAKIRSVVPEFRQTIFLNEGIRKTINAYKTQNYQCGIDWKFDADTDRIIKKWCNKQGINPNLYNLKFTDYLGNSTFRDKMTYWLELHKGNCFVKIVNFGYRVVLFAKQKVRFK
jgi:nucleoside-diphosphate-sugar epimerase